MPCRQRGSRREVVAVVLLLQFCCARLDDGVACAEERPNPRAAVVRIGGCSGVCVDPAGLVMTAKHCDLRDVERVQIGDKTVLAIRIYEAAGTEGPVVYDCVGASYPWAPVADGAPDAGERVMTMGFPMDPAGRRFHEQTGTVLKGGEFRFRGELFLGNVTDISIREGWSGGPLFNSQGEVIGLANSTGAIGSVFITSAATRAAYDAVQQRHAHRLPLQVVVSLDNPDCRRFLADYAGDAGFREEIQEHFQVTVSDASVQTDRLQQIGSNELPVFLLPRRVSLAGYRGEFDLLKRLHAALSEVSESPAVINAGGTAE